MNQELFGFLPEWCKIRTKPLPQRETYNKGINWPPIQELHHGSKCMHSVSLKLHKNVIVHPNRHPHTYANLNRFLPLFHHAPESWAHSRTTGNTLFDIKLYRNSQHDAYNELSKKKRTSQCRIGSYSCSKMPTHVYIIYKVLTDIEVHGSSMQPKNK